MQKLNSLANRRLDFLFLPSWFWQVRKYLMAESDCYVCLVSRSFIWWLRTYCCHFILHVASAWKISPQLTGAEIHTHTHTYTHTHTHTRCTHKHTGLHNTTQYRHTNTHPHNPYSTQTHTHSHTHTNTQKQLQTRAMNSLEWKYIARGRQLTIVATALSRHTLCVYTQAI